MFFCEIIKFDVALKKIIKKKMLHINKTFFPDLGSFLHQFLQFCSTNNLYL